MSNIMAKRQMIVRKISIEKLQIEGEYTMVLDSEYTMVPYSVCTMVSYSVYTMIPYSLSHRPLLPMLCGYLRPHTAG